MRIELVPMIDTQFFLPPFSMMASRDAVREAGATRLAIAVTPREARR